MKTAFVFLATGFEEIETLGTVDILRRGGIRVYTVSIMGEERIIGAHNVLVTADLLFEDADYSIADALILPGGIPGSNHLNTCTRLKELIKEQIQRPEGVIIAAICGGPMVLGSIGILRGVKATCFPNFEPTMIGAICSERNVEIDILPSQPATKIITSRGPGCVFEFGLTILLALKDREYVEEVAAALLVNENSHENILEFKKKEE